jgi:hypothetical protein
MDAMQVLEGLSYLVTIVGLPFAIGVFLFEQRRERANEEEEIYLKLSEDYSKFMELVLQNADLQLRSGAPRPNLTDEQHARSGVIPYIEQAAAYIQQPKEEGTVQRNNFQIGGIQSGEQGKRVCHTRVVGQSEECGGGNVICAEHAHLLSVALQEHF